MASNNKVYFAIVFALMSASASYFLFGLLFKSPAAAALGANCPESFYPIYETKRASEQHRVYSGIEVLDTTLCQLVTFFLTGMDPKVYPTTFSLLTGLPSAAIFPIVESARLKAPGSIIPAIGPMIVGIIYQRFGGGTILPLYWIFILYSGRLDNKSNKQITPRQALSVLAGLLLGYYVPTYLMLTTKQVFWTALFQPFPVLIAIVQFLALLVIPNVTSPSGGRMVQMLYGIILTVSAASHWSIISQARADPGFNLKDIFVPSIKPIMENSMALVSQNFLQWDNAYIFTSAATLSLAFADSLTELLALIIANLVLSIGLGGGSAFAAVMIWREEKMLRKAMQVTKTE